MNPAIWLVFWLASTALACLLTAWAVYQVGYDHGHDEATDFERGRNRIRPAAPEPEPRQLAPWELEPEPEPEVCCECGAASAT